MAVARYVAFDLAKTPKVGSAANCQWKGMAVFCGPRGLPFGGLTLYKGKGDGTFTAVEEWKDFYGFTVMATDYEVGSHLTPHPNLRVVSGKEMRRLGLTYTDLLAASDVVATKLGYGIVSECLANGVALLYTLRGRFIEQNVFIREMPAVMRSLHIDTDDLREGRWAEPVEALLAQPGPAQPPSADGADVVARRMMEMVARSA